MIIVNLCVFFGGGVGLRDMNCHSFTGSPTDIMC